METEPKDVIVLGSIRRGKRKFSNIQNETKITAEELNSILEDLENKGYIRVEEKKGWFGKKIELKITENGSNELDKKIIEIQSKWKEMQVLYQNGDKQKLQEKMEENDPGIFRDYLFDLWQGEEDKETVMSYKDDYIEACKIITSRNNRLLVSAFAGGDLSLLNLGWKEENVYQYNPNPYHLNRRADNGYGTGTIDLGGFFDDAPVKEKKWNFASLVQEKTRKWLKLQQPEGWKWEIVYFGAKRGKYKSERKTEPEMVKVFESQWGCLMPGYFHAGSGWWRARPLQVADAGSILIGDKPEMMVYYKDEALAGLTVADVEAMSDEQLAATAKAQRDALYANHPLDKNIQQSEIRKVLEA